MRSTLSATTLTWLACGVFSKHLIWCARLSSSCRPGTPLRGSSGNGDAPPMSAAAAAAVPAPYYAVPAAPPHAPHKRTASTAPPKPTCGAPPGGRGTAAVLTNAARTQARRPSARSSAAAPAARRPRWPRLQRSGKGERALTVGWLGHASRAATSPSSARANHTPRTHARTNLRRAIQLRKARGHDQQDAAVGE